MSNGSSKSSSCKLPSSSTSCTSLPYTPTNIYFPQSAYHFLAGLSSGIFSAILLQPADLLKTRVQQSHSTTLLSTIRSISSSPNSILAFWRGTLPSALRTGFGSAIYFTSLNALRSHVANSNLLLKVGVLGASNLSPATNNHSSSTLPKLSNLANLTTGAIARTGAGLILMPMTIIKVRYESSFYTYQSIASAGKDILRTEGLKGFFSGFGATAIRDAPYAGLYVLFYEQLKKRLSILSEKVPIAAATGGTERFEKMKGSTSLSINFTSGILAAGLATAFTNPFDAIKTRIQLKPKEYHNLWHAARKMVRAEGWKSLLDGLGLRMGRKALSSAMAWTVYEELVRRASEGVWTKSGTGRREGIV